jgi:hypothetical protein
LLRYGKQWIAIHGDEAAAGIKALGLSSNDLKLLGLK